MGLVPKAAGPYKTVTPTGGRRSVSYRDAKGVTRDAVVLGAGTGATLNLSVRQGAGGSRTLTNVPKRTGLKQTNVWF